MISFAMMFLSTYILGSSTESFSVTDLRIIGLDPLNLLSAKEIFFLKNRSNFIFNKYCT